MLQINPLSPTGVMESPAPSFVSAIVGLGTVCGEPGGAEMWAGLSANREKPF